MLERADAAGEECSRPLPMRRVIEYDLGIAEALATAHEKGEVYSKVPEQPLADRASELLSLQRKAQNLTLSMTEEA